MNETYSEGGPLVFPNPPKTLLSIETPPAGEYVVIRPEIPPVSDLAALVMFLTRAGYAEQDGIGWRADPGWGDPNSCTDRVYRIYHEPAGVEPLPEARTIGLPEWYWSVILPQGVGYNGFWCEMYFDQAGHLLHHGVWE
jgi:hypothetical protein